MLRDRAGLIASAAVGVVAASCVAARIWSRSLRNRRSVVVSLRRYAALRWHLSRADRLVVVADFDRTISNHSCNVSCHGVLEGCTELGAEYRAETLKLKEHYLPLETTPDLTIAQKLPLMQDWYRKSHGLLAKEPLTEAVLERAAKSSGVVLRPGFVTLALLLEKLSVPLIVCSAGLGNVVRALLLAKPPAYAAGCFSKLPIVSNWLTFGGEGGRVSGFSEPLLHMYNKNGAFLRAQLGEEKWAELGVAGRSVALVIGDGLGDATMADGIDGVDTIVRIGFLNEPDGSERCERLLPQYLEKFDAVILGDQSFDWLLELLPRK